MANTDSQFTQESANPDFEIFVGFSHWRIQGQTKVSLGYDGNQAPCLTLGGSTSGSAWATVQTALKKTGAGVGYNPGASGGYPPILGANLPTLKAIPSVATPKGTLVNSVDLLIGSVSGNSIFSVLNLSLMAITCINGAASNQNIKYLFNNVATGPVTVNNNIAGKVNVPVPAPSFLILSDTCLALLVTFTISSATNACIYGANFKCSMNLN